MPVSKDLKNLQQDFNYLYNRLSSVSQGTGITSIPASIVTTSSVARFTTDTQLTHFQAGYDKQIVSAAFSGVSTKTLTLTRQDGSTLITTFNDEIGTISGVISLNGETGSTQSFATATTGTDFTISSASGTHTFSIPVVSGANTGKVTPTLFNTWNGKQDALSGTGFVKISGTTVSYDNTSYLATTSTTTNLPEGTNLYFTDARAIAAPITGYVSGTGTIAATDTIVQAISKLNGNMSSYETSAHAASTYETTSHAAATYATQAEIDATQTGAGLGSTGTYTADATTNYLTAATSLKDADKKLDTQVKVNTDAISTIHVPADYIITQSGSTVTATPVIGSGLTAYSGTDAYTVIQAAVTALTPSGSAGTGGGKIVIGTGTFTLSDEVTITGWEGGASPLSQLLIQGSGLGTRIVQNTSAKSAFVVLNKADVAIRDILISVGSSAASGILLSDAGTSNFSVINAIFDNIYINSTSTSSPAFYAKNYLRMTVGTMQAYSSNNTAMQLENTTTANNNGNGVFLNIKTLASTTSPFAGLVMKSTAAGHPMTLNVFNRFECLQGYYGVYMYQASYNTFNFLDCESMTYPLYIDGAASGFSSRGNKVSSGYLLGSSTGTTVTCTRQTGGNTIYSFLDGSSTTVPINDLTATFYPANEYNVVMGSSQNEALIVLNENTQTLLTYKKTSDNLTVTHYPTPANNDASNNIATTAFAANASNLSSGTVADARQGTNVALRNATILPTVNNSFALGSSSFVWGTVYSPNIISNGDLKLSGNSSTNDVILYRSATGTQLARFKASGNLLIGTNTTDNGSSVQALSLSASIVSKTANYTVTATDYTILGDATTANFNVNLPTAVGCTGRIYIIKKTDAGANTIFVVTASSQNINGVTTATSYSLSTQGKYVMLQSDNVGWQVIGNN